ncbi:hypothetical protein BGW41_001217 [Actinomortierella wolfii]|nr:hypothetical protein BGW41_001217 [Actinomortierella wolfii]
MHSSLSPMLGYTKAVRVCDDCFDVAYLVAYILSDDLGPTTQIHGARGLYDIVEGNDERAIQSVLDHGGLDAMIFLCRMSHSYELHALATSFMATLTDKGEQMKLLIVSKRAMSNLYHLVTFYGLVQQQQQRKPSSSNVSPTRSPLPATAYAINPTPMPLTRMGSVESIHTRTTKRIETITLIMMNVTHVIFRMVSSSKDLSRQLARDGGLDCLMTLSVYFPAGVRTRAMEEALKTMAQRSPRPEPSVPRRPLSAMSTLSNSDHELQSDRSSISGRANSLELAEVPGGGCAVDEDDEENTLIHMDEWFHERVEVMQQRAAKSISIMASDPVNQAYMVEDPERVDRMVQLLYSTNPDVVKYAAKTTAFLSLRNDKHKTSLVRGAGVAALLMVIRLAREQHFSSLAEHEGQEQLLEAPATNDGTRRSSSSPSLTSNTIVSTKLSSEAVSHACCTLANLATSIESQDILMSYTDLIELTCGVVGLYPSQTEVERHVSRLLANLALYDQNKLCLLTDHSSMPHDQSHAAPITNPYRYSSPPPPPHRAKGNVIPTLMFIGAMTLELPSYSSGFQDSSDPYYVHHPVAVFPDTSELVALLQEPFEIPELPSKESNGDDEQIEQQHAYQLYPHHHQSHTYGTSPASARHGISSSPSHANMSGLTALTAATIDLPMISATAWRTVPGTDDIQRHFIRAIDNLLTSTPVVGVDSPEAITEETFKVFLKLWPTISLILAIRAATRDEDTQRRATHVLSTLKQQRTCHQSFIDRFVEEHSHHPSQQQYQKEEEEKSPEVHHRQDTAREHVSQERLQEQHEEQEEAKRKKQREEDERWEKERAEAERIEEERRQQMEDEERRRRLEQEENERRAEEERREKERLQHEAEERARLQKEQEEQEKEQKRLEKERLEQEAKEKAKEEARLRKEREEAEEAERRRLKQQEEEEKQKAEEVRKQKEKEEAEEAERRRLKQEEEEKKQKAEEARKKKEKEEAEEAERRRLKQEEEEKKAEEARKKKEKEEAEEAERRRLKQEEERKLKEKEEAEEAERRRKKEKKQKEKEEEAILRLEEQEGELERNRGEREKLKMKKVEDRIQQLMERKDREAVDSSTDEISSATEDEVPARSAAAAKKSSSSSSKDKKKKKKKSK